MVPSAVLVSSPRRVFGTMKSSMLGNTMPSSSSRRSSTAGSPTKRPLAIFNDENADPTHPKRVKSALISKSTSNNENVLFSKQHPLPIKQEKTSRFVLTDRLQSVQQKPRSALGNITNIHHRVEKSKPRVGSSLKNVTLNASPPRRRPTTPPRSARDRRVPFTIRVDPPVPVTESVSSIDSVIRDTTAVTGRLGSSLNNEVTTLLGGDSLCTQSIPDSWQFTIYEDTPEETLQNMMEHSTNTLDLSDDESSRSGLSVLGKENIPPAETYATTPENQMSVDAPVSRTQKHHTKRQPLREMAPIELGDQEEEGMKGAKVPTLEKEGFVTVTGPEKKKPVFTPRAKCALEFTVCKDPVIERSPSTSQDENPLPPVDNPELKGDTSVRLERSDSGKKRGLSEI